MAHLYARLILILALVLGSGGVSHLDAQQQEPYTLDQLVRMVESGVFSDQRILSLVEGNCLAFVLDEEAGRRLGEAGASENLITELRGKCVQLPPAIDTVMVTPSRLVLTIGDTVSVRARALAADSTELEAASLTWASADTTIATVMPSGVITAVGAGETRVSARSAGGPGGSVRVRVREAAAGATGVDRSALSVNKAAALGVVVPGGGEFYTGNRTKGIIVAAGAVTSLVAGYLITTEDEIGEPTFTVIDPEQCTQTSCPVRVTRRFEETRQVLIGAAVASAFWIYGLVDGIMTARRSQRATRGGDALGPGTALRLVPPDGLRASLDGEIEITLVRVLP